MQTSLRYEYRCFLFQKRNLKLLTSITKTIMEKLNSDINLKGKKKIKKGIDTVFKVVSKNHQTLSENADRKANILLSVNAIILSITLSRLLPKFNNSSYHYLMYPSIILLFFAVISILISIAVTKPHITANLSKKGFSLKNNGNVLFFGNFHKMSIQEFENEMDNIMRNKEILYMALTKDLYYLGEVLWYKYALLKIAYNFFIIGIITTVISFVIAFYFAK